MTILRLTNGTTTLDLLDSTNYLALAETWAPNVAKLRRGQLGRGIYEPVIEEFEIMVRGATAATALANLQALSTMLDQAERWARLEPVTAVRIQYQPNGSALASPVEAVVMGYDADSSFIGMSTTIEQRGNAVIGPIKLRFKRGPLWIGADVAATSSAVASGNAMTATFGSSASVMSPVKLEINSSVFNYTNTPGLPDGYVLVASSTGRLVFIEAESALGTGWTSVAETQARGGAVARATPATLVTNYYTTLPGVSIDARVFAVFALIRLNVVSGTPVFTITTTLTSHGTNVSNVKILDSTVVDGLPHIQFLGTFALPGALDRMSITVQVNSATGSPTVDFDYFCLHAIDDDTSRIIALDDTRTLEPGYPFVSNSTAFAITFDDQVNTGQQTTARLAASSTSEYAPLSYRGPLNYLLTTGTTLVAAVLMCGGTNLGDETYIRLVDITHALVTMSITATRHTAYLTPQ